MYATEEHTATRRTPRLPAEFWAALAPACDLATQGALAAVCTDARRAMGYLPGLRLARAAFPGIAATAAPGVARLLQRLAVAVCAAPHAGPGGAGCALRTLAHPARTSPPPPEPCISAETARAFLGLVPAALPPNARVYARADGVRAVRCAVQHRGPCGPHAPGYRVECAALFRVSRLLAEVCARAGPDGLAPAVARAQQAADALRVRQAAGRRAKRVLEATLWRAGVPQPDAGYLVGTEAVQRALFGANRWLGARFVDALARCVGVHGVIPSRLVWLWVRDGNARRKATLCLNKWLAAGLGVEEIAAKLERSFWWAGNPDNVASMPWRLRSRERRCAQRMQAAARAFALHAFAAEGPAAEGAAELPPNARRRLGAAAAKKGKQETVASAPVAHLSLRSRSPSSVQAPY